MRAIRLTVVLTHPVQYYAPWFRHVAQHAGELELTVVYAVDPSPEQQGVGFERAFAWDIPLTGGYRSIVVRPGRPGDRVDSGSFFGLDVSEIGRTIESTTPDVVLVCGWYSITLIRALVAARRLGVPVLYRGDSHLLSGPRGWRRTLWVAKTWLLLKQFDGFLSPGTRVNEYLRWFGTPDYRIFSVPHAVDNDLFARSAGCFQTPDERAAARRSWAIEADTFVPLFVGKLIASKRPLDVVRALARLGSGVTLLVAGSGRLEMPLREEAARLGVDLRLPGFLNQSELGKAYAAADCLVLPSDETWGLVVNEALATGLPAVVSDAVGCAPDLVTPGETGLVHPLGDVAALAGCLDRMRQLKAAGHDWATRCRARVANFSYGRMTEQLAIACRSVLPHSVERGGIDVKPGGIDYGSSPRILALCGSMVIAGGLERMAFRALAGLHGRGAAVHCIVNDWEHYRISRLAEEAGATWSAAPYRQQLTRRHLTIPKIVKMAADIVAVSVHLLREAHRFKPTHILIPDYHTVLRNLPTLVWLKMKKIPIVVTLQNAPAQGRFYRVIWRWLVDPVTDAFVCNSTFTERELRAHRLSDRKIRVIPNVATPRRSSWDSAAPRRPGRIIYVGQIIPEKGVLLLLDAVALLRSGGLNATLDVVGDIDGWEAPQFRGYRDRVRARAAQSDLAGAVRFLGWREDVPELMAAASVHCCPSLPELREAFGLVVLEAKLSGLPSVVLPSGYLPDLVSHRVDGWVCAEASAHALADGLRFFLEDNGRLRSAGRAARDSASRFSPERYADAWERVFA